MGLVEMLQEKLPQYKFHALSLVAVAALAFSILRLAPRFITVVSFFWPLLLSTAFLLVAVLVLRFISPPHTEVLSDRTGEEFMDYVASRSPMGDCQEAEGSCEEDREEAAAAAAAADDAGAGEEGADSALETKKSQ